MNIVINDLVKYFVLLLLLGTQHIFASDYRDEGAGVSLLTAVNTSYGVRDTHVAINIDGVDLNFLPEEIVVFICHHMDIRSLIAFSKTSRKYNRIAKEVIQNQLPKHLRYMIVDKSLRLNEEQIESVVKTIVSRCDALKILMRSEESPGKIKQLFELLAANPDRKDLKEKMSKDIPSATLGGIRTFENLMDIVLTVGCGFTKEPALYVFGACGSIVQCATGAVPIIRWHQTEEDQGGIDNKRFLFATIANFFPLLSLSFELTCLCVYFQKEHRAMIALSSCVLAINSFLKLLRYFKFSI